MSTETQRIPVPEFAFTIFWRGEDYRVNIPEYEGGTVIPVEKYQELASNHQDLLEALKEATLQIEYLHHKFKETGSGNQVLSRCHTAISAAEEKQ